MHARVRGLSSRRSSTKKKNHEESLAGYLGEYFTGAKIEIVRSPTRPSPRRRPLKSSREDKEKIHNDPVIKQAEQILGGGVVSVKPREKVVDI
ncbi:MAG: hypothetical protein R3B51_01330 [Thermodesulfobacteriota bacterium]